MRDGSAASIERFLVTGSLTFTGLEDLGATLMRVFAVALGVDEHFFDDKIDRHFSTLPVNHYPEPDGDPLPNQIRAGQ